MIEIVMKKQPMPWDIVALFIFFAFPLIRQSFLVSRKKPADRVMNDARALQLAGHETLGLLLFGGLVWHQRKTQDLSFRCSDVGQGVLLYLAQYVVYLAGHQLFLRLKLMPDRTEERRQREQDRKIGKPLLMVVNPIFEEFLFRYYLPTRLEQHFLQKWLPHVIAVAVQFAYHTYQGLANATLIALMFMVSASHFYRFRRIWPVILAHAAFDWVAYFHHRSRATLQVSDAGAS